MPNAQPLNGSEIADPTPAVAQLPAGKPGVPPLQCKVWPDWRGAPNDSLALTSVLVCGIVSAIEAHTKAVAAVMALANRIAALEVAVAESHRLAAHERSTSVVDGELVPEQLGRAKVRHGMAMAAIESCAAQIEITATPTGIVADDTVGTAASALDLLGVEDGPAPAAGGIAGPTNDGGD